MHYRIDITKLMFYSVFLLALTGCFGSGSSDETSNLQLSKASATTGSFITVQHDSIEADTEVALKVTYSDSGQKINLSSIYTENGSARFIIPPYFDSNTKRYTGGTVRLSLVGTNAASDFVIDSPVDLSDTQSGFVMAWLLGHSKDKYESALTKLTSLETDYAVDVSYLRTQLIDHIALLDASIEEIESLGQLTIVDEDGTINILGAEELRQNDTLFFSMASGFAQEYEQLVPEAANKLLNKSALNSKINSKVNFEDLPVHVREPLEKWAEGLKWASTNGGKLGSALIGGIGIIVTIEAGTIGLPIIFLGAVGYAMVDGVFGEGLDSLADKLTLNDSGGYEFGEHMLESAEEAMQGLLLSLGGAKSKILDFIGTLSSANSVYEAVGIEKCDALEQPESEKFSTFNLSNLTDDEFCSGIDALKLSVPIAGPLILNPNQSGGWFYAIYGGVAPYQLTVSWGDGNESTINTSSSSGSFSHSYTDNARYVIGITVISSDGLTGSSASLVWVEASDSLSARITVNNHLSNYAFESDYAFVGFGSISENNAAIMSEIPSVAGFNGTRGTSTLEVLTLLISKDINSSILPLTISSVTDDLDAFTDGVAQSVMNFATPRITHQYTENQVVFFATGGSIILNEYGNQLGDRISGSFSLQITGERNLCSDPPECDVSSDEILTGTAIGEFDGTLKLEEDFYDGNTTP